MYGLVNKAIQDLVTRNFGEEKWLQIKTKAGFEDNFFVGMRSYPDELTYNLVGAASEVLKMTPEQILNAFGEYWILFTADEGYREILKIYGSNLRDFLMNLNNLHDQVGMIMPNLTPPKFTVRDLEANKLELIYQSTREGLAPMVVGLLKGLGARFNQECEIIQTGLRSELGHDIFEIKW